MSKVYLTSFYGSDDGDDPHWSDRQARLHRSALTMGGVDEVIPWNREKLQGTTFWQPHAEVLSTPRGAGYWLWKPYIIQQALNEMQPNDFLVYHDVGRPQRDDPTRGYTLERDVAPLVRWAAGNRGIFPGVYMPHHGKNQAWTKRDCFVLMDCDAPEFWQASQIQATYNIWQNTKEVRDFVDQWLAYATDPRMITDSENTQGLENLEGFKEHRHDQSILTNLCIKKGIAAFGEPKKPILLHRNLNSLIRHARLNELANEDSMILRSLVQQNNSDGFDRSMIRWLELYYCERREQALSVLLVGPSAANIWQQYLPGADITYAEHATEFVSRIGDVNDGTRVEYDLVVVNAPDNPNLQFDLVSRLISRVTVSGLLICGPVRKAWDQEPRDHRSGLALVRDYWKNKRFCHPALPDALKRRWVQEVLMTFSAWDHSGEVGNAYFVRHDS